MMTSGNMGAFIITYTIFCMFFLNIYIYIFFFFLGGGGGVLIVIIVRCTPKPYSCRKGYLNS